MYFVARLSRWVVSLEETYYIYRVFGDGNGDGDGEKNGRAARDEAKRKRQ